MACAGACRGVQFRPVPCPGGVRPQRRAASQGHCWATGHRCGEARTVRADVATGGSVGWAARFHLLQAGVPLPCLSAASKPPCCCCCLPASCCRVQPAHASCKVRPQQRFPGYPLHRSGGGRPAGGRVLVRPAGTVAHHSASRTNWMQFRGGCHSNQVGLISDPEATAPALTCANGAQSGSPPAR